MVFMNPRAIENAFVANFCATPQAVKFNFGFPVRAAIYSQSKKKCNITVFNSKQKMIQACLAAKEARALLKSTCFRSKGQVLIDFECILEMQTRHN